MQKCELLNISLFLLFTRQKTCLKLSIHYRTGLTGLLFSEKRVKCAFHLAMHEQLN